MSAALLDRGKGYAQHEQQAGATVLGTPQHPPPSCLPFWRPQPCCADKHAHAPPNPCASRTSFSPGEWCNPGTSLALRPACAPLEPSWKTQTKQGEKRRRKVVHWHTPTAYNQHQQPSQQAQVRVPCGLLWGQSETLTAHPKGSPLGGCQSHVWRTQMRSQTGSVDAHAEEACVTASSMTRDWCAMLGHAFPIDDGTTTPSFSPDQVPTNTVGYSTTTPNPRFTCRGQQPKEGPFKVMAAWPWTGLPHQGTCPSSPRVGTPQQRTTASRHHSLAVPRHTRSSNPTPSPFQASRRHHDHAQAACDHHCHHQDWAHRSGPCGRRAHPASAREWHFAASPGSQLPGH